MFLDRFLVVAGVCAFGALATVFMLARYVLKQPQGNEKMAQLSTYVQQGAAAFLKREYAWVFSFVAVIFVLLSLLGVVKPDIGLNYQTGIAFICGAVASCLAGVLGMTIATRSNARTAAAAESGGVKAALDVAISGGAVMGLGVVGIALLGLVIVYKIFDGNPVIVNGYSMGASLVALFARAGGGIFTKGADMGADLVGKVEAGIPEDDPRNPAVIADNVGDNVGDVAGLGADLLESYVASIIASLAVAMTVTTVAGRWKRICQGVSLLYCQHRYYRVHYRRYVCQEMFAKSNPQSALMMGTYVAAGLAILGVLGYSALRGEEFVLAGVTYGAFRPAFACMIGVVSGMAVGFTSEYFTSGKYKPVQKLAERCQTGPAIAVTEGTAVGMQSTAMPVIVLALPLSMAYACAGVYGVAIAAFGMLATTGMVVAVDAYGPIADNAGGIAEMAGLDPKVRKITDNLDAVGNTTAAIGKGFAIGSAAFASIGLLSAFMIGRKSRDGQYF
jgi:K(+)-stimulated pyrophosphate-energized sodium pump